MNVTVAGNAALGSRNLVVSNPGTGPGSGQGAADVCEGCFSVVDL